MLGVMFTDLIVQGIERYTVMYIAGSNLYIENEIVFVTGGMRFVRKTLAMLSLVENSAFRIGCRYSGLVSFRSTSVVAIIFEGFLIVIFPYFVYFVEQFFCIAFCFFGNGFFCAFTRCKDIPWNVSRGVCAA